MVPRPVMVAMEGMTILKLSARMPSGAMRRFELSVCMAVSEPPFTPVRNDKEDILEARSNPVRCVLETLTLPVVTRRSKAPSIADWCPRCRPASRRREATLRQ